MVHESDTRTGRRLPAEVDLADNAGMSQTAAIAGVTLALKALLEASLKARGAEDRHLADVLVTTMPVDRARGVHHR